VDKESVGAIKFKGPTTDTFWEEAESAMYSKATMLQLISAYSASDHIHICPGFKFAAAELLMPAEVNCSSDAPRWPICFAILGIADILS